MHFLSSVAPAVLAATVASAAPTINIDLGYVASNATNVAGLVAKGKARIAAINGGNSEFNVLLNTGPAQNVLVSYVAPVKIGGATQHLIVDTGSSNTWCGAQTSCEPTMTGQSTGGSVSVSYGSGSFSGNEFTDKVTYAGLTVNKQSIGSATQSTGFTGVDGIFGLGPVRLTQGTVSNANTVPTFMDNLYSQGSIAVESLGVYFRTFNPQTSNGNNGQLTLGGPNPKKYKGTLSYNPKLNDGSVQSFYWTLLTQSFQYGSTTLSTNTKAIIDTGTTLIYIPTPAFNTFLSASGGSLDPNSGLVIYNTKPTGTFAINIGGRAFTLTPAQYLVPQNQYGPFGLQNGKYYAWINDGGTGTVNCLVGQKFLEWYYSVYDTTNARIGFATRA